MEDNKNDPAYWVKVAEDCEIEKLDAQLEFSISKSAFDFRMGQILARKAYAEDRISQMLKPAMK